MKMQQTNIGDVVRDNMTLQVQVELTGIRLFKFRLWLGSIIMRLAARVIGCGIEIKGTE